MELRMNEDKNIIGTVQTFRSIEQVKNIRELEK